MKKFVTVAIISAMVLSLCACGGKKAQETEMVDNEVVTTSPEATEAAATPSSETTKTEVAKGITLEKTESDKGIKYVYEDTNGISESTIVDYVNVEGAMPGIEEKMSDIVNDTFADLGLKDVKKTDDAYTVGNDNGASFRLENIADKSNEAEYKVVFTGKDGTEGKNEAIESYLSAVEKLYWYKVSDNETLNSHIENIVSTDKDTEVVYRFKDAENKAVSVEIAFSVKVGDTEEANEYEFSLIAKKQFGNIEDEVEGSSKPESSGAPAMPEGSGKPDGAPDGEKPAEAPNGEKPAEGGEKPEGEAPNGEKTAENGEKPADGGEKAE